MGEGGEVGGGGVLLIAWTQFLSYFNLASFVCHLDDGEIKSHKDCAMLFHRSLFGVAKPKAEFCGCDHRR